MRNWLARVTALIIAVPALALGPGSHEAASVAAQVVRPRQDADRAALAPALAPFIDGLTDPIFVTHAGDGSGRLFVVERRGQIKVVVDGQVLPTPFLDLSGAVTSSNLEQGLLGLAFHPNFRSNGRVYVYSTPPPPTPNPSNLAGYNALAEYRVQAPGGNQADPATRRVLFSLPDRASNHNGGMLTFGPDGYLYVAIGDEGGGNNQYNNAQTTATLFGKVLRLDVDRADAGLPYGIPPSNPFVGQAGARAEIWAYGLRNPWRVTFDRATGDLWIADVGQASYEEINRQPAGVAGGRNYGWSVMEGLHCFGANSCDQAGLTLPVAEYGRDGGCSITGGYVYRGSRYPELAGAYVYGDYCSGRIWTLRQQGSAWVSAPALDSTYKITSFGEDEGGELYVVHAPFGTNTIGQGAIYRLTDTVQNQVTCSPRPRVAIRTTRAGSDELLVTVTATTNGTGAPNALTSIELGAATNATVSVGGAPARPGGFVVPLEGGTTETTFTVQRFGAGAMHIPFKVADRCGIWPSFVGAGAGP